MRRILCVAAMLCVILGSSVPAFAGVTITNTSSVTINGKTTTSTITKGAGNWYFWNGQEVTREEYDAKKNQQVKDYKKVISSLNLPQLPSSNASGTDDWKASLGLDSLPSAETIRSQALSGVSVGKTK